MLGPRRLTLVGFLALGMLAGCSQDHSEKLVPVAGRVTVNGKPLATGAVSFRPDRARGNRSGHHPTGEIDAAGNYELFTINKRGAPPGWYRVLVLADENRLAGGAAHPLPPRWLVHARYTTEQTTDLLIEVIDNPPAGRYDLRLSK